MLRLLSHLIDLALGIALIAGGAALLSGQVSLGPGSALALAFVALVILAGMRLVSLGAVGSASA